MTDVLPLVSRVFPRPLGKLPSMASRSELVGLLTESADSFVLVDKGIDFLDKKDL